MKLSYALRRLAVMPAIVVFALSTLLAVGMPRDVHAATFTVTVLPDILIPGSLRQALIDAAGSPGPDTINFAPIFDGVTVPLAGPIHIATDVVIDATDTPHGYTGHSFIITGGTVELKYITILDGDATNGGGIFNSTNLTLFEVYVGDSVADLGGGIYNAGTLNLNRSRIESNDADLGAGIYNTGTLIATSSYIFSNEADDGGGLFNTGTVTFTGGGISGNEANRGFSDAFGGGIYNDSGSVTLVNTIIYLNSVSSLQDAHGGGIYNQATLYVTENTQIIQNDAGIQGGGVDNYGGMYVRGSNISGNGAQNGAGIDNYGYLELTDSTVTENIHSSSAAGHGGGFRSSGTADVLRSTINDNEGQFGGGIENTFTGTLTITQSTISGNESGNGAFAVGGSGGGIYNQGELTVTSSTFSANTAEDNGGGIRNSGTLTLTNTTLTNNAASENGGGIYGVGGSVSLRNSIVSGNIAGSGPDCSAILNGLSPNLVGSTTGCVVLVTAPITGDAMLGLLGANGGPTRTHALLAGSPAIDSGDDTVCTNAPVSGIDQRGESRPSGSQCDLGAFEVQNSAVVHELSINDVTASEGNVGTKNFDFTVTLSAPSTEEVLVYRYISGNSAITPTDFQSFAPEVITFSPGQTSKTVTVVINGDPVLEPDETFNIYIYNPVGATITDDNGIGTILNDDVSTPLPVISVNDVSVSEGDEGDTPALFTISLDPPSPFIVSVRAFVVDGTATAYDEFINVDDYLGHVDSYIVFEPGVSTQTVSALVVGDTRLEPDENFYLNLSAPQNATIGDSQGVGTILNDDEFIQEIMGSSFEDSAAQ